MFANLAPMRRLLISVPIVLLLASCASQRGTFIQNNQVSHDSQLFLIQGMQVDAFNGEWYSTEGDTLWNYHNDYRVRLLLAAEIPTHTRITLTATSPEDKELFSQTKTAGEAESGTLFFTIPKDAVNCLQFIATVTMDDSQQVKHSLKPNVAGCGE